MLNVKDSAYNSATSDEQKVVDAMLATFKQMTPEEIRKVFADYRSGDYPTTESLVSTNQKDL